MIKIEVSGNPPILMNARMHWAKALKLKQGWYEAVHWELVRTKSIPRQPFQFAVVHYTRFAPGREPDQTNLISSFKWPEDALVRSGVLIDDKPENVMNFYHWERSSRSDKRIQIVVSPIPRP